MSFFGDNSVSCLLLQSSTCQDVNAWIVYAIRVRIEHSRAYARLSLKDLDVYTKDFKGHTPPKLSGKNKRSVFRGASECICRLKGL